MKKVILLLCSIMLSANVAFADSCFIAKENGKVLQSEGDSEKRYAPMSTFKITLDLIRAFLPMKCTLYGLLKKVMLIGVILGNRIKLPKAG